MLEEIKAVLFDLDGTIVDSMWMWKAIDEEYLARFGKEYTPDLSRELDGKSIHETAVYMKARYEIPDPEEKMIDDWNEMARLKYRNEVPLKEGVLDFLKACRARGIRTGIATSNSRELTTEVLVSHGVMDLFDCILTSKEVKNGKPRPDIYLMLAKEVGVSPEHCLVFEDVVQGLRAGNAAGMRTCAIEDPYSAWSREEKLQEADYYIDSFEEVLAEWDDSR